MALYDLIAFDLDGTVFESPMNQRITKRVEAAMQAAHDKGTVIAANTGRPLWMLGEQLLSEPWLDFAICTCGSSIEPVHFNDGKTEDAPFTSQYHPFSLDDAYDLVALLSAFDAEVFIHTKNYGLIDSTSTRRFLKLRESFEKEGVPTTQDCFISLLGTQYLKRYEHILDGLEDPSIFSNNPILKIDASFADHEIRDSVADKADSLNVAEVARVSHTELEITYKGCSKYSGLTELAKCLNISPERCIAFGDSGNDASLCGKDINFVAMANSEQKILDAANFVTDSVQNDGVASWIEKYILA